MQKFIFILLLIFSTYTTAADVVYVGDSIAAMMKLNNPHSNVVKYRDKNDETAVGGKNPKWIYERLRKTINRYPTYLQDRIVVLSSGYSNDPDGTYLDYHERIIRLLLSAGVQDIRILGMASNYYMSNRWGTHYYKPERYQFLKNLAQKYNLYIYPEYHASDKVHMTLKDIKRTEFGLR